MTIQARQWTLDPDRCFSPIPRVRERARALYEEVRELPLVSPHGHVPPNLLADPDANLEDPAQLLIIPDHYVFRMLHSQGIPLERLGIRPRPDGSASSEVEVESDPRAIWQLFCENFHLFRGTPTGLWLSDELVNLFGVEEKPSGESAQRIYTHLERKLAQDEFRPRALLQRFGIEVICTTDAATDDLSSHHRMREEGLPVRPTFRPDRLLNVDLPEWRQDLLLLGERVGLAIDGYGDFVQALAVRRQQFITAGARASDHGVLSPHISSLSEREAEAIFERALSGELGAGDARRFEGHMLMEMARMSSEDGLVMQLHVGSLRNHNRRLFERFGADMGADIPVAVDWTRGLQDLLNRFGNEPSLRLIVFTLDESSYGRELAPLAGHYPALRLGAPWWFFDSVKGMERYLDLTVETAGFYNLAGFNDDTRAFPSIPSRHDVWRRVTSNWLAMQVESGLLDGGDAIEVVRWLAVDAAREAYRLPEGS